MPVLGTGCSFPRIRKFGLVQASAVGQVLAPGGPWLISMESSKGKHAGSHLRSVSTGKIMIIGLGQVVSG